ncbi:MAG: geranylgeranylglycerol-phosphate geranylgeranyltransferase [Candidatus Lokiarchaeota archaeon]|nr:geranylgeranylglycerol-phosphate geranylgeranyltransferase [Candidatus Lokiarchaeota archaeon]
MKFKDTIGILRPINDIMGSLTVFIGILVTRTGISFDRIIINIILGVLTYFFIAGSGMVINDIYDVEIDKINRPERPIPRGAITLSEAKYFYAGVFILGITISIIHSIIYNLLFLNVIIATFFGFMGWVYAKWGKKSGFFGNIIVSISFSIGFIYGAVLNSSIIPIYIYFFFLNSVFGLLSREIIKGCEDIEGDKELGVNTLAIKIGLKRTPYISMICVFLSILFFILAAFTELINQLAFSISMIFGIVVVLYAAILMPKKNLDKKDFSKISLLLKIGMFLGLIAVILASIEF